MTCIYCRKSICIKSYLYSIKLKRTHQWEEEGYEDMLQVQSSSKTIRKYNKWSEEKKNIVNSSIYIWKNRYFQSGTWAFLLKPSKECSRNPNT